MKKLFALLLSMLMIFFVASAVADAEINYYGGYAAIEISKNDTPTMFVIYFAEDGTCYYLAQMFHADKVGLGRAYIGSWHYTENGDVFAKIGDNTSITFKLSEKTTSIMDSETYRVFFYFDGLYH